jgi:hypothetical protein
VRFNFSRKPLVRVQFRALPRARATQNAAPALLLDWDSGVFGVRPALKQFAAALFCTAKFFRNPGSISRARPLSGAKKSGA